MFHRLTFILGLLILFAQAVPAAPKTLRGSSPTDVSSPEPWLMGATGTRRAVLADLAPKAKQPPYDKAFPLLQKAQAELPQSGAAAVDDAYDATLLVMPADPALAARLFDGFLLASLCYASPDPARYDGRLHLLKTAVGVYGQAGLPDRQLAALRLLRSEAGSNQNLQDWVSLQFSSVYAKRGQYAPAMDALDSVQTPGMRGPVAAIPDLQRRLADQQDQQELQKHESAQSRAPHTKAAARKPAGHQRPTRRVHH